MSRGPGRWQRAILDELQRREVFYVRELLPATPTRSEQLAVIRAAHRLAHRGLLVDKAYTTRYDYALQAIKELPYGTWREYDPEDTVRFYALRLHEAGMLKSTPQKLIAQGTDWRFLKELKKELKG
jgi:hypothetical protein